MAEIAPLRALRYARDPLPDVLAPPYDVIGPEEREELGARSTHNIVHLDLPAGEGDAKYANAARLLRQWIEDGVLARDRTPALFRYEQDFDPPDGGARITRRGFFALVRAEPYEKRSVLPHERTLSGPKEDRYKLFVATRAALSPVFLLYTDPSGAIREALDRAGPGDELRTRDGIVHRLARLEDPETVKRAVGALASRPLLIADGHHRYETTVRYAKTIDDERAARGQPARPRGSHHYAMAFLADASDPGLVVFPTHRIVRSLAGFDYERMIEKARATFDVAPLPEGDAAAITGALAEAGLRGPTVAALAPDGRGHLLTLRADLDVDAHPVLGARPPVLRRADVVVLHAALIEAVLGITAEAQAKETHLRYVKSTADAIARIRRSEGDVLFLMNPTPVDVVRRACEAGEVMPQKSTYFYPKVPTGLFVHVLDPDVDA
jgi:uncharacterized protein (DUF1015 family)